MNPIFYISSSNAYQYMADNLIKSIKMFYPNIPIKLERNEPKSNMDMIFSLRLLTSFLELLDIHNRIIYIDSDSLMCGECPELFGDFDIEMPINNTNIFGASSGKDYLNNGLVVFTNKEVIKDLMRKVLNGLENDYTSMTYYNEVFYSGKYKTKILSYPDKSYGLEEMPLYPNSISKNGSIYMGDKKACIIHFAGPEYKQKINNRFEVNYYKFLNPEVQDKLKNYGSWCFVLSKRNG